MSENFDIKKAFSLGGMVWFKAFKTMLVIGMILVVVWSLYATIIKPQISPIKTTTQTAEQIVNPSIEPRIAPFSCAHIRTIQYYREKKNEPNNKP